MCIQARRLDRTQLLEHYHSTGARGSYLATSCSLDLATGQTAKLLYIMPKYSLRMVVDKPAEMQAVLRLSLAESSEEVQAAASNPTTGTYDVFRHIYLRQTFVALYVVDKDTVLDSHKDFVSGGGHTDHSHFLRTILHNKAQPLVQGPKNSQAKSKKPKAKAKRSAKTKAMLAAPESALIKKDVEVAKPHEAGDAIQDLSEYLPGLAAHKGGSEDRCFAKLARGTRFVLNP